MLSENQRLELPESFITESGATLSRPVVAYEEYGQADGPVILVAHGTFSDQHAAGRRHPDDTSPGWWDGLIGPGKPFDTERFRILSINSLGSMYGSTGPLSINPDTGGRYGPLFPSITLVDMVRFQKAFLDALGVEELHLMAGPSLGSLQALQMAALYPEFVGAVVAVATAGRMPPAGLAMHHFMINTLRMDPDFQGGWYEPERPLRAMKTVHQYMRLAYIHEDLLRTAMWDSVREDPQAQRDRSRLIEHYLTATLDADVRKRDPNSYITLMEAANGYDLGRDIEGFEEGALRILCPVLLLNVTTDAAFQLHWAEELGDILNTRSPGQARVGVLESHWGHMGSIKECHQMAGTIHRFMTGL